jgi:hypothetical protein
VLPGHASCAVGSGPVGSEIVFAGTAVEARGGYTRFEVEEVWTGPPLAPEVWIRTGQDQSPWPVDRLAGVSSSTDAELTEGEASVVGTDPGAFATSVCATAEAAAVADLRPADARPPDADGLAGADPPNAPAEQVSWLAGLAAALGLGVAALRRLRR